MKLAVPADYRVKTKENEKSDKYLDLARKRKKIWNVKVIVITVVIDMLGAIPKCLVEGLEDLEIRRKVKNIQTSALGQPEYWEES